MIEHTQTVRRLLLTNCLSVFDHFVRLTLKGLFKKFNDKCNLNLEAIVLQFLGLLCCFHLPWIF